MLFFSRSKLDPVEARLIALRVCQEHGWPMLEPIRVRPRLFSWIVTTNAKKIGCNVRIKVSRKDKRVVWRSFSPR